MCRASVHGWMAAGLGLVLLPHVAAVTQEATPPAVPGSDTPIFASAESAQSASQGAGNQANGQQSAAAQQSAAERAALVNAATNEAVDRLMQQIEAQQLAGGLTVADLLDRMPPSGREKFRRTLRGSPQVGGPRFSSPRSAQVHLVERGERVADRLLQLARSEGLEPALSMQELDRMLTALRGRTFTATGGSMVPHLALQLAPNELEGRVTSWSNVSDEAKRAAIDSARGDAVDSLIEAARPVRVAPEDPPASTADQADDRPAGHPRTLGDLMDAGTIGEESRQWLSQQPLTRLRFEDDLRVSVKLAVEPAEWVQQLRVSMERQETGLPALSDEQWLQVTAELAERVPEAAVGSAEAKETQAAERLPVEWPARAPEWARGPISVQASAPPVEDAPNAAVARLLTRQAAEQAARQQLSGRLDAAPVDGQTLGQIAQRHPHVRARLDEAIGRATPAHTAYLTDGSVQVLVPLDGPRLWRSLQAR